MKIKKFNEINEDHSEENMTSRETHAKKYIPGEIWDELVRFQKDLVSNSVGSNESEDFAIYANLFVRKAPELIDMWAKGISRYKSVEEITRYMRGAILHALVGDDVDDIRRNIINVAK